MYEETSNDLAIKHDSSMVGFIEPTTNRKTIALLSDFEQMGGSYSTITFNYKVLTDIENNTWEYRSDMWYEKSDNFILDYPSLGVLNYDKTVVILRRKLKLDSPTKYRKSLREDSYTWFDPNMLERELLDMKSIDSFSSMGRLSSMGRSIFFPEYMSSKDALESIINNKRVGAAFSDSYYFTLNSCNNTISLWRLDNIIGTLNHDKEIFELDNDYFLDDLLSFNVPVDIF